MSYLSTPTFLLSFLLFHASLSDTLQQLIVVSRHGIRGPSQPVTYAKWDGDTSKGHKSNPCKLNLLNAHITELGHQQNKELGKILKSQYTDTDWDPLQLATFNPKFHVFYAADVDKDLMSGSSVAQGLFPDYFKKSTDDLADGSRHYDFTPSIPVHPLANPHVLTAESNANSCQSVINSTVFAIMDTDEFMNVHKYYASQCKDGDKTIYQQIKELTTVDNPLALKTAPRFAEQNILSVGHLYYMNGSAKAADKVTTVNGYTQEQIEECTYDGYTEKEEGGVKTCTIDNIKYTFTDLVVHFATLRQKLTSDKKYRDLAKLRTTPFIRYVHSQMMDSIDNKGQPPSKKFIFFLAENGNVQNLIQLFNLTVPGRVPFGSSIAFELWKKTSDESYGFKVKYRRFSNNSFEIKNLYDPELGYDYAYDGKSKKWTKENTEVTDENGDGVDWTQHLCKAEYCPVDDLLSWVWEESEWRSRCGIQDQTYYQEELKETQSSLSDTEDDKDKYRLLFLIFLIVLAVIIVVLIVVIVLQCLCGCCVFSRSSSSSSNSKEMTDPSDTA